MKRILITYGWVRSSYAALRNLSKRGVEVFVSDSERYGMCQFSKYKSKFLRYTSHYDDEQRFIQDLIQICEQNSIGLLLPSHNETEIIAKYKNAFPVGLCDLVPDYNHCKLLNNKSLSYDFASKCGLNTPKRIQYKSPDELFGMLNNLGVHNAVVKLLKGNSSKGVYFTNSIIETVNTVKDLIKKYCLSTSRYPQVEELVSGEGWGCSYLFWHGKKVAHFGHRRLREKLITGGPSTLRESYHNPTLISLGQRLLENIGWHGLAMVEFKFNPKTGSYWFIEVNPRLWGSLPLSISAGVEFPYLAYLCSTVGPQIAKNEFEKIICNDGWISRWLLGDIFLALTQLIKLNFLDAGRIIFNSNANYLDDIHFDDLPVFFGQALHYAQKSTKHFSLNPEEKGMVG